MLSIFSRLWRWRRLIRELAVRELRSRYVGSLLGGAWALLEPLVQLTLYFTVFSYFLGMRIEGRPGVGGYAMYLVSGLVPFQILQECLVRATGLARAQAGLVRHVSVPLEVLLGGAVTAVIARHCLSLLLVAVAAVALGTAAWSALPLTAAGLLVLITGVIGLSLVLLPAGAFLPDLAQIVATGCTVLFFATPIVYPIRAVPAAAARVLAYNPLTAVVDAIRATFTGVRPAPASLLLPALVAVALLLAGAFVYASRHRAVRDVV